MSLQEEIAKFTRRETKRQRITIDVLGFDDGTVEVEIGVPDGMGLFTAFGVLEHAARKMNYGLMTNGAKLEDRKG